MSPHKAHVPFVRRHKPLTLADVTSTAPALIGVGEIQVIGGG